MRTILAAALLASGSMAQAEVVSSGPHGFHVRQAAQLVVPPDAAFQSFAAVSNWWSPDHSYSGEAANLSMALRPGGCFCERLPGGGGVEHLKVTYVDPAEHRAVLTGSLGPLLNEATSGAFAVKVERIAGGSRIVWDYKVAGFANGGGERMAPLVDSVLAEQMKRFRTFAATRSARP